MRGGATLESEGGSRLIAAVVLAGGCALAYASFVSLDLREPGALALFALIAAVAQRQPVFLFRSSAVSVAFAATIATYVLAGTGAALWVNLASAAVNAVTPRRKPFVKIAFNAGNLTLSAFLAAETYRFVGGQTAPHEVLPTVLAVAASAAVYFLVNSALTAAVISLTGQERFGAVWKQNYSWMVVNYLAAAVNGAALAFAYQTLALFGAMVFLIPLVVAWYSFKLYMVKSTEVRERNADLVEVNNRLLLANDRLEESHLSIVGALVGALEAKDRYTHGHSAATMFHAVAVARALGLGEDDVAAVQLGALFHDIGKIGIPEAILRKSGPLDQEEWAQMREHPLIGASLLARVPTLERVRPIVLAHHEHYDGTGYPLGLAGDQIPLAAQVIAVADAYEAMTSTRPYRRALPHAEAIRELHAGSGTQFNPRVVSAFTALLDREHEAGEAAVEKPSRPVFGAHAAG